MDRSSEHFVPYFDIDDTGELGDTPALGVTPEYSALPVGEIVGALIGCACQERQRVGLEEDPAVDDVLQGDLGYIGAAEDGLPPELVHDDAEVGRVSRFDRLTRQLAQRGDVRDPRALAAWIGRRKYGKKKFFEMGLRGRGLR